MLNISNIYRKENITFSYGTHDINLEFYGIEPKESLIAIYKLKLYILENDLDYTIKII